MLQLDSRQARLVNRKEKIQQLALEQGKQMAELELERKQLEQQQAGILPYLHARQVGYE